MVVENMRNTTTNRHSGDSLTHTPNDDDSGGEDGKKLGEKQRNELSAATTAKMAMMIVS